MARAQEKDDSVYDFLYVDFRRIALFLSQFTQYGHLTSLTRTATETTASGGGMNVHVVKLDGSSAAQTSQTRQFDPQWIAPLSFLDEASKKGMIVRGLKGARIGQFVLVSGALRVLDASFMKDAWQLPAISKVIRSGQPSLPKHARPPFNPIDIVMDLLKVLPHPVQAQLDGPDFSLWCGLAPDNLVTAPSDLLLKHGIHLAGEWNILGILDAEPERADEFATTLVHAGSAAAAPTERVVATVIEALAPITRSMLGRQPSAYGVTPLLIFREVSA